MKLLCWILASLLLTLPASSEPKAKLKQPCSNGFVLWLHSTDALVTTLTGTTVKHLAGLLGTDHIITSRPATLVDCFDPLGTHGHHFQYVCDNAFFRVTAQISGSVNVVNRSQRVVIGQKVISSIMVDGDVIAQSGSYSTSTTPTSYERMIADDLLELQKDFFYAILISAVNTGGHTFTMNTGDWVQITEDKCPRGAP